MVLLPEMAFSGYTFRDRAAIRPCLEDAAEGPTAEWCQLQARRLRCSVVCGFPRRVVDVRAYLRHTPSQTLTQQNCVGYGHSFSVQGSEVCIVTRTPQELVLCGRCVPR